MPTRILCCAALAVSLSARAQETPAHLGPVEVRGFVDLYADYNANRPADGANFIAGTTGTSAARADELSINLAQLSFTLPPAPIGFTLAVGTGTGAQVVTASEVTAPGTSPALWRMLQQAYIVYKVYKLTIQAGLYPSQVGLESFPSRENWTYTRGWMGEFSPYYQAGVMAGYDFSEEWSAQLHLLNGWQMIGDVNDGKTLGTQVAWKRGAASVLLNGLLGPELPHDDRHLRGLLDLVATLPLSPGLSFQGSADAGMQQEPQGPTRSWRAAEALLRYQLTGAVAAVVRAEVFADPHGGISGTPQTLVDGTAVLEVRPDKTLLVKIEGRYDHSTAAVFSGQELLPDGTPIKLRSQFLFTSSAVASF